MATKTKDNIAARGQAVLAHLREEESTRLALQSALQTVESLQSRLDGLAPKVRGWWREYGEILWEGWDLVTGGAPRNSRVGGPHPNNRLFNAWVQESGLDTTPAKSSTTRKNAMWLVMQWETISTARPVPEGKNHPTEIREAYRKLLKQQEEDRKVAEEQARYEKRYKQLKKEAKKQREAEEAALPPPPPDHTEEFLVIAAYYAGRGNLTVEEACAILGFTEVVRLESAKWVYKMYVQKYHTDREGGNPEIAQLLNVVKQTLDF